jgi:4-amino-4-deoxy-L-arabinose transferase-like glycosyltransferase
VNNDDGLILAVAALFYALARAFRHGLTDRRAVAIGAALGLGLIAKANLLGFLPGVVTALALLIWRAAPAARARAARAAALAVVLAAIPVLAYVGLNHTVWDRPLWSGGGQVTSGTSSAGSFREELSYTWQLYLPRMPFMNDEFVSFLPLRELWFDGFIGRFGWLDYGFRPWVYDLALYLVIPILLLAVGGLVRSQAALRRRLPEFACYALAMLGLLVVIAVAGYGAQRSHADRFEQARYLLPLLPLYGALIALAARGAGRRWGPAVGGVIVVLAMAHGLFSMLLTISRYYG